MPSSDPEMLSREQAQDLLNRNFDLLLSASYETFPNALLIGVAFRALEELVKRGNATLDYPLEVIRKFQGRFDALLKRRDEIALALDRASVDSDKDAVA